MLAALGCVVHMSERRAEVHQVLHARVAESPWRSAITCALEDARERWGPAQGEFDVVYLDPMFGAHPKGARPAKHMQVLATLAAPVDDDELANLIAAAKDAASSRLVVKRRSSATTVGKPNWAIRGRSVRFDVYRAN